MVIATQPVDTSTHPAAALPDDELLGAMLDAHRQSAFNLAYRLVRRPEDAADAVQDAFVLAVRATRGDTAAPRDADRFRPWLLKIVANVALGQLRRKRSDLTDSLDELTFEPADPRGEQPLAALMRRERRGDVLNALLVLADDQRIALTLREYQELSYDEIGRILDLDRAATTALIYRARCAFRRAYQGLMARSAPIGCPELAPLISAMLDEELDVGTWQHVEQHVAGCRGCRLELRQLRGARRLHATIPLLAPPAGWSWTATLEVARTVGGVGAAGLASSTLGLGPALTIGASIGAASALPGASLGGLLSSFGGLLTGRITGLALLIGLNLGVMVGAPTHQTAPPSLAQAEELATPAMLEGRAPAAPAGADVAIESDRPADGSQAAASSAPASTIGSTSATGPASAAEPASAAGLAIAPAPASAPAPAASQSAPAATSVDDAGADAVVTSGPPGDESESQASRQPSEAEAAAPAQNAASAQAASNVQEAGPATGEAAGEPVPSTVAAVVDAVTGLPQGELPSLDIPRVDVPAIDVPPIDPPALDLPEVDLPPIQAPSIDVPPLDVPPVTLPVAGVPPVDLPPVDVPAIQAPPVDLPAVDLPEVDLPAVDLPVADLPEVDLPEADLPEVDLPAVDLPAVDLPAVDPSAIQLPVADLPALQVPGDQARGVAAPAARDTNPDQQPSAKGASLESRSEPGSGRIEASLTSVGTDEDKGGVPLVEVTAGAANGSADEGATRVDASVNAPTVLSDANGASTLVDASSGVPSAAVDGGGTTLTVHSEVGAGNHAGVGASVDSGTGTGTGMLESSGAGSVDSSSSVSVSVDNGSSSGGNDSNSSSVSVSVDNGSSGGGNDSNSSSASVSVSFDTSSNSSGGGDNGSSSGGGGGGASISVGGISVSLP